MTTALIAKGALGALAVGGAAVTCVFLYSSKPTCISIGDSTNNSETYSGKLGEDFKFHFVSVQDPNNSAWWNWVFKNIYKEDQSNNQDTEFQNVDSADKLKGKCGDAYKKTIKDEIHKTGKENYEKNIWRYCSVENKKPIVVKDAGVEQKEAGTKDNDSGKIGKTNDSKLISTLSPENDWFWKLQEKSFFKKPNNKDGIGKAATDTNSTFKTLYEKTERGEADTLKKTCADIYNQNDSDATKKKDALTFCSLQAKSDN